MYVDKYTNIVYKATACVRWLPLSLHSRLLSFCLPSALCFVPIFVQMFAENIFLTLRFLSTSLLGDVPTPPWRCCPAGLPCCCPVILRHCRWWNVIDQQPARLLYLPLCFLRYNARVSGINVEFYCTLAILPLHANSYVYIHTTCMHFYLFYFYLRLHI